MLSEDIDIYFSDFGVAASWTPRNGDALQTAKVIEDAADEEMSIGASGAVGRRLQITYPSTKLVGMEKGEGISVNGIDYIVRDTPMAIDDGAMMIALLGRFDT